MTEQKYEPKVGFWRGGASNFNSSIKGLDAYQIEMLHSLKVGDRLVLWQVTGAIEGDTRIPALELKIAKNREPV